MIKNIVFYINYIKLHFVNFALKIYHTSRYIFHKRGRKWCCKLWLRKSSSAKGKVHGNLANFPIEEISNSSLVKRLPRGAVLVFSVTMVGRHRGLHHLLPIFLPAWQILPATFRRLKLRTKRKLRRRPAATVLLFLTCALPCGSQLIITKSSTELVCLFNCSKKSSRVLSILVRFSSYDSYPCIIYVRTLAQNTILQ